MTICKMGRSIPLLVSSLERIMFGYKDQQDLVVTPNNPLGEEPDPDKLVEQYQKALPPED